MSATENYNFHTYIYIVDTVFQLQSYFESKNIIIIYKNTGDSTLNDTFQIPKYAVLSDG